MADERDPKLSQRYRELEALEPPAELDRKILAAAHAAEAPHAPLVAPAGRHRWYYSLAAAAVLVFAVALTLQIERARPDPEAVASASVRGEIKPAPKTETAPQARPEQAPVFAPDPRARVAPAPRAADLPLAEERMRADQAAAKGAATQAKAAAEMRLPEADARQRAASAARPMAAAPQRLAPTTAAAQMAAAPENPERWLERIADLRSRGQHMDADRELAAFRKAYPDYRLSDLMRERVERTPLPSR